VISGNGTSSGTTVLIAADGVEITGAAANGNVVRGNLIGLNAAGTAALDNTAIGLRISGAPNTLVGGATTAHRNVIADSLFLNFGLGHGVEVAGAGASGTVIQGNYIGTDATGTVKLGVRGAGIYVNGAPGVSIGGTGAGARNLLAGSKLGTGYGGIRLLGGATGAVIEGNYIGTNVTGTAAFQNNACGICVDSGAHTIGGTVPGAGNLISGNTIGINFAEVAASGSTVQGNLIGTDVTGTVDLGNLTYGIRLVRSTNNLFGGSVPEARNLISGNDTAGVLLLGSSGSMAPGNVIQGNYIGTNLTGTGSVGNGNGVVLTDVSGCSVLGNLVSGNGPAPEYGIGLHVTSGISSTGNVVKGNRIGTNAAGTAALPNARAGMTVSLIGSVTIGGSAAGEGNVISANAHDGISLCCGTGTAVVWGNRIGTDLTGALDLRNGLSGISIGNGSGHTIGGVGAGEGNVIAFNATSNQGTNYAGVKITNGTARVRGNALFSNTGIGIDLSGNGVNANDACDPDSGPNDIQNYPVLASATQSGPNTAVTGTLNSAAATTFTLDFYATPSCDTQGNGEGKTYLGSTAVTTEGSCNGSFSVTLPAYASGVVTATATNPAGATSEFSSCRTVGPSPLAEVAPAGWTGGKDELTWSAVPGATEYKVVRGTAADLPQLLDGGIDSCERFRGSGLGTGPVLDEDPVSSPGRLYWYLVIALSGTGEGPAGNATAGPRLVHPSGACP
jgi:hypothetical protein